MRAAQQIFRVRREYNQWVANQTLEDYALRFTAKSARRWTAWQVSMTALGATAFMALEAIGGAITLNYGFVNAVAAMLAVGLVFFLTGYPISYFAAKHGVDIDLLTRGAGFGYLGSTVTSLIYATFTFIFFAIEAAILAMALKALFGIPVAIGYILCAIAVVPVVTHGITAISRFQLGTQSLWLALQIAALLAVAWFEFERLPAWSQYQGSAQPGAGGTFNLALFGAASAMLFALIAQIGEQVDYLRFLPPQNTIGKGEWWSALLLAGPGWILIGIVKLLAGSFLAWLAFSAGADLVSATDPTHMYQAAFGYITGSPALSLLLAGLVVIISQMKINVTNAYAGSIAWSNFFSRVTHSHPGRVVWLVFNVVIALVLMELGIYQALENTLSLFAIAAVSWLGTISADLTINRWLRLRPPGLEFRRAHLYDVNPVGTGSMLIATGVGLSCYFGVFGAAAASLTHYLTLLATMLAAPLLAWYTGGRYYIARTPELLHEDGQSRQCCICENHFELEDMSHCPAYQGPICSLCCSLDSRCMDRCKPDSQVSSLLQRWLSRFLPASIAQRVDSRVGQYLTILLFLSLINAALFTMVFYSVSPQDAAGRELVASALRTLYCVFTIISGVSAWLFLLTRESRVVAHEESNRQTQLLVAEIEAHRETDRELQDAKEVAEAANQAKSRYLAGISHELRTPLQSILGYTQILSRHEDIPRRRRETIDIVRRSGEYLADLIEGLLDISRIEAGRLEIRREQVDLQALLDEMIGMFSPLAHDKSIAFESHISENLPRYVTTDEKRLRQVLINLLSNAVKFTERGQVDFSVRYRNQVAEFEVSDTGCGIAAENTGKIFNPFERLQSERRTRIPGTGLGLTIVKLLVELMGGNIAVQSTPGAGTRFTVMLMLATVRQPQVRTLPTREVAGYEGPVRSVMVVDDEPDHRQLIADLLLPLGFDVQPADNAAQCLDMLRDYRPDLLLVDVSMPGMNGLELVARLRKEGVRQPVIMISADAQERHGDLDQGRQHDDFMVKPIKLRELLKRISAHLQLEWRYAPGPAGRTEDSAQPPPDLVLPDSADLTKLRAYAEIGYLKGVLGELAGLRDHPDIDPAVLGHLDFLARQARLERIAQLFRERS
ncbi:MAG: hybrid sensor histidine kinase/response regulator [Halioglobus sp.]|nr:hybrid sensor histidine kinase/response regulator [Halioglobus sp.]|tara:strand:- start:475 stop:3843 length:3369 start_codon:yes stop_codon:yes gene_type:complete